MPNLQVRTNLTLTAEQKQQALVALSKLVVKVTGKPESYVQIVLQDGLALSFGGTPDPTVFLDFRSIGCISGPQNKRTSAELTGYFTSTFGVPGNRVYISFANAAGENWGFNGGTFG
jgi:phenylpyruvate tautomerase PptA (4-oxalocrotonate tautomerase family)